MESKIVTSAKNGDIDNVKLLLDNGADIESRTNNGSTLLMIAVHKRNEKMVKFLLNRGANVNAFNDVGYTPLMYAVPNKIIKLLVKNGADPFMKSFDNGDQFSSKDAYDTCYTDTSCRKIISRAMWKRMNDNIKMLSRQYSQSADFTLPRETWELILLRNKQQSLCNTLSTKNESILRAFADYLEIPLPSNISQIILCHLISRELSSLNRLRYTTSRYDKTKGQIINIAYKLGIDVHRPINKIVDDIGAILSSNF